MMGKYLWVCKLLKNMDEKQLEELFIDIGDKNAVIRIYQTAYKISALSNRKIESQKEEDEEHKAQDDRDRAMDINSTLLGK